MQILEWLQKKKVIRSRREKELIQELELEKEVEEVEDPLYVSRINFELFKSIFKKDPAISAAESNGRIDPEKMRITRLRESGPNGVTRSVDAIRLQDSSAARHYMDMANRAFGVKATAKDGYIYFNYDIEAIEKQRKVERGES